MPDAREAGRSGDGVLVAVVDSWVDGSHPDFEGRVLPGGSCASGVCRDGAAPPDACDHGTHVAGTVASSSYGVAPKARVLPVTVLTYAPATATSPASCGGTANDVAAGIRYAVARGARVVNLSLGGAIPGLSSSSAIGAAVADAARAGVLTVFAAGNASLPIADAYGGDALIVAATGPDGQLAGYSQRDIGISLAAPGGDPAGSGCTTQTCIISLLPAGQYGVAAGTSMAAPHVSGIAALLLSQNPARSRGQLVERLRGTARPLTGAGSGLVDATAALGVAAQPGGKATTEPSQSPLAAAPPSRLPPASGGADRTVTPALPPAAVGTPGLNPGPSPALAPPDLLVLDPAPVAAGTQPIPAGPARVAVALVALAGLSTAAAGVAGRPRGS